MSRRIFAGAHSVHATFYHILLLRPTDAGSMFSVLWAHIFVSLVNVLRSGVSSAIVGHNVFVYMFSKTVDCGLFTYVLSKVSNPESFRLACVEQRYELRGRRHVMRCCASAFLCLVGSGRKCRLCNTFFLHLRSAF